MNRGAGLTAPRRGPYAARVSARHPYRRPRLDSLHGRCLDGKRAARLRELASAYLELGQPAAAAEILKGALVLDNTRSVARVWLALSLYRQGDFAQALAWLEGPPAGEGPERWFLSGMVLRDLGRLPEALAAMDRALAADPAFPDAYLERGRILLRLGRAAEALAEAGRLLEARPGAAAGLLLRARALLALGRPAEAAAAVRKLPAAERSFDALELLIRALRIGGAPDGEVDAEFAAARERISSDARVELLYARDLILRSPADPGSAELAEGVLRRLLERPELNDALRAMVCFSLSDLLAQENRDPEGARRVLEQGLLLAPDHPQGLLARASLELGRRRPGRGLQDLLRVLLVDPQEPRLPLLLARMLAATSDDEAVSGFLGLLLHAVPADAPTLLTRVLRLTEEEGRAAALEDVRREAHRMKNRLAVFAAGLADHRQGEPRERAQELFRDWTAFLKTLRATPERALPLDPADVLRRAVQEAAGDAGRIACSLPGDLPLIQGDVSALSSALANVLRNALEASPPGGPVEVRVRARDEGRRVEFCVLDFGPGIALSDQPFVFEPGFSRKPSGSGLGLSVARAVVLGHGGRLRLASAPGGPTKVTIELPALGDILGRGEVPHGRTGVAG